MKTASGKTAVQMVWTSKKGSRKIEHLGAGASAALSAFVKSAGMTRWPRHFISFDY